MTSAQDILAYAKLHDIYIYIKDGQLKINGTKATLTDKFMSAAKEHKLELIESLDNQPIRLNPELAASGYQWCYDCVHWNGQCTSQDNPYAAVEKQPQFPRICKWYEAKA